MILDRIVLDNFGAYAGRQQCILTPEDGKPVILFGGMNGGGKTTLLDSVQLAFYGAKAKLSNRGRLGYRDYLRECIHRGTDPVEGAAVTVQFRRMMEGEVRYFELQRSWREGPKGIEETVRVSRDGEPDDLLTEHWEETIEAYLPVGIAHLFFFDGEQIKELAEGGHAAEIVGTAIHSLLGLDLVERLNTDLKVFERRKRAETLDPTALLAIRQAEEEVAHLDEEEGKLALEEGALVNEAGRLGEKVRQAEDRFRSEGGDLFLQRQELDSALARLQGEREAIETELRALAAGPLPLLMVVPQLLEAETQARHETEIRRARVLGEALEERDQDVLHLLESEGLEPGPLRKISNRLKKDRKTRRGIAEEPLILDSDDHLPAQLAHLREAVLPQAERQAQCLLEKLGKIDEEIARVEAEIARIPEADQIAVIQEQLDDARAVHKKKMGDLEAIRARKESLRKQREAAEARLDKVGGEALEARFDDDARQRMLKHSARVRNTLGKFRVEVIRRHARQIESLMLESFRKLLRKTGLVTDLTIDPESFAVTLMGRDGKPLSFDRLSAGERQLLATSLLWGLARASGRPVPTIIDTPLGRLDSSHRRHLIERYFPAASHQVILLSTDEEIVGDYLKDLTPFVTRSYHLAHDEALGRTQVEPGYFPQYETAS